MNKSDMKVGKYYKSDRKGKKLMIRVKAKGKDKKVHFGATGYQDFTQHKDPERRESFLSRMKGVKKNGKPAWKDPLSPAYHAVRKLW